MGQPHKHAEVIKAWADGATIEWRSFPTDEWSVVSVPSFRVTAEYRIKPEPPAKVYPEFDGDIIALMVAFGSVPDQAHEERLIRVGNAALRHAIDAGQVVTAADHQAALDKLGQSLCRVEIERCNAARDLAIAEAVRSACFDVIPHSSVTTVGVAMMSINVARIISETKD